MSTQTVLTSSFITNKRKSDASDAPKSNKKARTGHATTQSLVKSILASPDAFELPSSDDDTRDTLVDLAQYIKSLESEVKEARKGGATAKKTPEQLEALAEKVRKAARSGIKKQMTWKASCKTGTAKWVYDGVCPDADAFAVVMGLDARPTWKMKKIPRNEFEELLGDTIQASVRYDTLGITSQNINVRWTESTGEFKFTGSYGRAVY